MPSQAVRKTQVYLPESLYVYLKGRAAKERTSMASVIRFLLQESAARQAGDIDDPFLALGSPGTRAGAEDGASNHDDHIYGSRH